MINTLIQQLNPLRIYLLTLIWRKVFIHYMLKFIGAQITNISNYASILMDRKIHKWSN